MMIESSDMVYRALIEFAENIGRWRYVGEYHSALYSNNKVIIVYSVPE